MEKWKDIKEFPNYQISNYGRVKSLARICKRGNGTGDYYKKETFLKLRLDKYGYERIALYNNGRGSQKHFMIHRLVAEAFIPNVDNKPTVNHIDGNKLNNYVSNLEYMTFEENLSHAWKIGLINNKGEKNHLSKMNEKQVLEIRDLYSGNVYSQRKLARLYNVSRGCIVGIIKRKTWKHI